MSEIDRNSQFPTAGFQKTVHYKWKSHFKTLGAIHPGCRCRNKRFFRTEAQKILPHAGACSCRKSRSGFPLYNLSVSLRSTAPLVGEPLAKPFTLRGLPKPPLGRGGGSAAALAERLYRGQAYKLSAQRLTFAGNGIY